MVKKTAGTPTVAADSKGWRLSVDLVDDPDFVLRFSTEDVAMAEVDRIVSRGYVIQDEHANPRNRYTVRIVPLHRIRRLDVYEGE